MSDLTNMPFQLDFGQPVIKAHNSLRPVTRHDLDILLAHILRVPEVLQQSILKNISRDFNDATELDHRLLYTFAVEFYEQHRKLITPEFMFALIERAGLNPLYSDPQLIDGLFKLATYCYYEFPEHSLITANALQIMTDFMVDRRCVNSIMAMAERGSIGKEDIVKIGKEWEGAQVEAARIVEPFNMEANDILGPLARQRIGVDVLDALMPGPLPGELYGFLAPTGGGKTTLSMQISIAKARCQEHVAFFTYEDEPNKEYMVPVIACATGIKRSRLEQVRSEADFTPDEKERFEQAKQTIGKYLHIIDLSGSKTAMAGRGGPKEIESYLDRFKLQGIHISVFVVDWFWIMMRRFAATAKKPEGGLNMRLEDRTFAQTLVDELKMAARSHDCWGWVNQQLAPAATNTKKNKLGWQDAAEFKSFAWFLNGCFALSQLDEHNMATLNYSKARSSKTGHIPVELKGDEARFVNCSPDMTWSDKQKKYVIKGKENAVPDDNLPRDVQRQRADYAGGVDRVDM